MDGPNFEVSGSGSLDNNSEGELLPPPPAEGIKNSLDSVGGLKQSFFDVKLTSIKLDEINTEKVSLKGDIGVDFLRKENKEVSREEENKPNKPENNRSEKKKEVVKSSRTPTSNEGQERKRNER